jgi:microcystin-dependent protein
LQITSLSAQQNINQGFVMSDPFLGEIRAVGFNFAPRGWALCDGSLLSIAQETALYELLGTQFGGDGKTTFGLPDLRGRSPVGIGSGPGLSPVVMGDKLGQEVVTIKPSQMPTHTHLASTMSPCTTSNGSQTNPENNIPAVTVLEDGRTQLPSYALASDADGYMALAAVNVDPAGGGAPMEIRNPYLGTNFIIATVGLFPSRG